MEKKFWFFVDEYDPKQWDYMKTNEQKKEIITIKYKFDVICTVNQMFRLKFSKVTCIHYFHLFVLYIYSGNDYNIFIQFCYIHC